jgi:hypothetical protein
MAYLNETYALIGNAFLLGFVSQEVHYVYGVHWTS